MATSSISRFLAAAPRALPAARPAPSTFTILPRAHILRGHGHSSLLPSTAVASNTTPTSAATTTTAARYSSTNRPKMAIPLASLGANPEVAQKVSDLLLPEYDVVHICLNPQSALAELPPLCAGDLSVQPSSGLGSNAARPTAAGRRVPAAVVFGAGIADEDVRAVMDAVVGRASGAPGEREAVKEVRVVRDEVVAPGAAGPNPEAIVKVLRKKLAAQFGEVAGSL